jgi:hypothetical protein
LIARVTSSSAPPRKAAIATATPAKKAAIMASVTSAVLARASRKPGMRPISA